MDLKSAITKTKSLPDKYEKKGMEFKVIIVPSDPDHKKKFIEGSSISEILSHSEKFAPKFALNSDFLVIGIWSNGNDFIYDSKMEGVS
ncbi:MAG: hypothetical protein RIM99_14470 [Cyclobacteriaceae bacterium]